ncbi:CARD- and ANK-domain containing inflammasome adapter protein [Hypanus sabinus]|uniref:CARD- and ANK-domain containing inflammasome adapter protein n=1 Tax=Hypanus sabinus TaxID=79690 RepID=UPI0028C48774|nr:CARD- and ANK-domain containing inflammasome adapter protein [Hypanus sabinus]XP_059839576.1 CARD- and ANK-domain containing inflammasome adapter protein [Hypanus sabinus]XP_059839578.1 CARD- and ANK-domain containing inflammasome adapter protein [Hypanus sabinus]
MPLHGTGIFTNPYAIEVLQSKKKELVAGITHTDDLLDWLIENRVISPEKRIAVLNYRTREEMNTRVLDMLVSCGERACRLFFYPCLKHVEPALYNYIRSYVSNVSSSFGDAKRQLVGYLLERDKDEIPKDTSKNVGKPVQNVASKKEPHQKLQTAVQTRPVHNELAHVFQIVASGDLSSLDKAIGHSDINVINAFNETLLHIAATHGHVKIIEYLLNKGAKLEVKDNKGQLPLHRAAEKGHTAAAKVLLQAGAHSYALDTESKTPLHLASQNNFFSVVKLMLKEEAGNYKRKKSFLHMAALRDESKIAEILLKCGAAADIKDEKNRTPLIHAVSLGHLSTVKVLLEAGAKVDVDMIDGALNSNNQSLIKLILEYATGISPNVLVNALFKAVQKNQHRAVGVLIERGIDINAKNEMQYTPLLLAAELGHTESVKVLITKGAHLNERTPNMNSALHLAAETGSLSVAKLLIDEGMDVNIIGCSDQTPLHFASFHNQPPMIEALIRAGSKVNAIAKEAITPLHIASQRGNRETVECLLQNKADVNAKDRLMRTPLHMAAIVGDASIAELLLSSHADPNAVNKEKKTPLHLAANEGHLDFVSMMLSRRARFAAKDMDGNTPMHYAASKSHSVVVKALLLAGKNKNIDDKNIWRKTPLHLAAEHSHEGLVELLLVSGASINALDNAKDTPLHCACKSGNIGTAQKLINWSDGEIPKFHSTNSLKKTPLQVAESRDTDNHQQIAILLRKKMMLTR